jgi:hypothetical protein
LTQGQPLCARCVNSTCHPPADTSSHPTEFADLAR